MITIARTGTIIFRTIHEIYCSFYVGNMVVPMGGKLVLYMLTLQPVSRLPFGHGSGAVRRNTRSLINQFDKKL